MCGSDLSPEALCVDVAAVDGSGHEGVSLLLVSSSHLPFDNLCRGGRIRVYLRLLPLGMVGLFRRLDNGSRLFDPGAVPCGPT